MSHFFSKTCMQDSGLVMTNVVAMNRNFYDSIEQCAHLGTLAVDSLNKQLNRAPSEWSTRVPEQSFQEA